MAAPVDRRIRLCDEEVLITVSCEILDVISDAAVYYLAIRRFDKTKLVDTRKGAHSADQADVGAFGRLDRANAAVVRRMNIAPFEAGTLPAPTSKAESRQTPPMRQFCEL